MSNLPSFSITYTFNGDPSASSKVNAGALDTQLGNIATAQNQTKAALDQVLGSDNNLAAQTVGLNNLKPEVFAALNANGTLGTQQFTGNLIVGTSSLDPINPEKVRIDYGVTTSHTGLGVYGSINDYYQFNLQNQSTGILASSDVVLTANNGTETTFYVDFGINGSNYTGGVWGAANDGYLYAQSGNLNIGTAASATVRFMNGGSSTASNTVFSYTTSTFDIFTGIRIRTNNNTAPGAGAFSGHVIFGITDGTSVLTGQIGEYPSNIISTATNAAASGSYLQLATISLTAGDWDIFAYAEQSLNAATLTANGAVEVLVGTTTASNTGTTQGYDRVTGIQPATNTTAAPIAIPIKRVQITATTSYFLNVLATYTAGTPQWRGSISARRVR